MLLAQTAADTNWAWLTVSAVVGVALLLVFVLFMVLLFRHLRSSRQLTHTERMRSLEAGFPLQAPPPPEETETTQAKLMHNAFWISFWIVVSVPAAALSAASAGTKTVNENIALSIVVWIGAAVVSVAAVVCATVLILNSRGHRADDSDGPRKTTETM
jgi:Ca2+/Na+ antiporter